MYEEGRISTMKPCEYSHHEGVGWDAALQRSGGDLLQSWRWGDFKQRHGWSVERIHTSGLAGEGMAQVLFRHRRGLVLAYVPRGPIISGGDDVAAELLESIDKLCVRHRSVVLVVKPDRPLPSAWSGTANGFASGPASFQASQTVKVQLIPDDDLLAQMRKDTGHNISHAQRNGIAVEHTAVEPAAIQLFYRLLQETAQRNGFRIHPYAYYEDFLQVFEDDAILLFSRTDGVVTTGLIAARFGSEGRSMYAGSATGDRARGDTALLRFEAMRWARDRGCTVFDLGGIAPASPLIASDDGRDDASDRHRSSLDGVRQFKVGFGGEIVTYPPTVERRYRPGLAWLVRQFHSRFRTSPPQE